MRPDGRLPLEGATPTDRRSRIRGVRSRGRAWARAAGWGHAMSVAGSSLSFASAGEGEELARAELYGVLAQLWMAPPDAALLQQFNVAVTEAPERGGHLEAPWQALVAAMRATTPAAAAAEHDALFGGVGKPEVFAYASYHLSGFLNERPLAQLREDLKRLGLTRDD